MNDADTLAGLLDRAAITRVVNDWGPFRDTGRWDRLHAYFTADATMHTTWFVGAAEEFVIRSIAAAARGARAQHFIGASTITLSGDRAVAETRMILMVRAHVGDVPVDVTCYGQFHDRFLRMPDGWRIRIRVPIYEKDRLDPLEPGRAVLLDDAKLASFAEGYRYLAYVPSLGGAVLSPDVPVPAMPGAAFVMIETELVLGGLETFLDTPACAPDPDQRLDGCSPRAPGGEVGKFSIDKAASDQ